MTDDVINSMLLGLEAMQKELTTLRESAMTLARIRADRHEEGKRLTVPWLSQLGSGAAYAPGDCGAACLAMLINYYRNSNLLSVDDVSKAIGKPRGYSLLGFEELINGALKFDLKLRHVTAKIDDLCAEIDHGKPAIVLVNYQSIPLYSRFDVKYNAGHYLLPVGYDTECIVYHDSYWPDANRGAYKPLPRNEFAAAYTTVAPGNQHAPHALVMA